MFEAADDRRADAAAVSAMASASQQSATSEKASSDRPFRIGAYAEQFGNVPDGAASVSAWRPLTRS
jgi:hypothetical protein